MMLRIDIHRWFAMVGISNRNIIIYLETKFRRNRRIFVLWWPFWIQNGHHRKPKLSPFGAACLTPCKYPFPLKFEKNQDGGHCHGNQGEKKIKIHSVQRILLKVDTKINHQSVVLIYETF
jgi:hypothetical protein